MRSWLVCLLLLYESCHGDNWLKAELQEVLDLHVRTSEEALAEIKQCSTGLSENEDREILAFVSFSMPDDALLRLASEMTSVGGQLVIRGLPKNSFKEFAQRVLALQGKGLQASLQIDPKLFEQYSIAMVPTVVLPEGNSFDKIAGHISLDYALEKFGSEKAIKLLMKLRGEQND